VGHGFWTKTPSSPLAAQVPGAGWFLEASLPCYKGYNATNGLGFIGSDRGRQGYLCARFGAGTRWYGGRDEGQRVAVDVVDGRKSPEAAACARCERCGRLSFAKLIDQQGAGEAPRSPDGSGASLSACRSNLDIRPLRGPLPAIGCRPSLSRPTRLVASRSNRAYRIGARGRTQTAALCRCKGLPKTYGRPCFQRDGAAVPLCRNVHTRRISR
jgi:cold shock CspA family protein